MASNSAEPSPGNSHEETQILLRDKLNAEKVKLWLPPYTTDAGEKGDIPNELISRYSDECGLTKEEVAEALEALRLHALEKLNARKKFESSGLATLRLKFAGTVPSKIGEKRRTLTLELSLEVKGQEFRQRVAEACGIDSYHLKLISCGHVIEDDQSLNHQGVRNNSQVLAICLSQSKAEAKRKEHEISLLNRTRAAAEILLDKKKDEGDPFIQIADQSGKALNLPDEERKALTLAMTLHEKGRASLKRKEYGMALLLLLEADKEFRKCRATILDAVDNYATLCLDIVWCYLCLKNVNDLPDAASRLTSCEECFNRSYGSNLERLASLKGESGHVLVLYVRLHLLQGVLAYYQHRKSEAVRLLTQSEHELKSLQVDDEKMSQVMVMGFSQREARLGLRACQGQVEGAVLHIVAKREERREIRKKENEERQMHNKLGKTADGKWVNSEHYQTLINMGYSPGSAKEALRQTNNNISASVHLLAENPELLALPDPGVGEVKVTDEMLAQVISLGFDPSFCRGALVQCSGNIARAVELLLTNGGILPSSSGAESSGTSSSESEQKTAEDLQREQDAMDEILPDIPEDEEDYLDITLEEEAEFIKEYKGLVAKIK